MNDNEEMIKYARNTIADFFSEKRDYWTKKQMREDAEENFCKLCPLFGLCDMTVLPKCLMEYAMKDVGKSKRGGS